MHGTTISAFPTQVSYLPAYIPCEASGRIDCTVMCSAGTLDRARAVAVCMCLIAACSSKQHSHRTRANGKSQPQAATLYIHSEWKRIVD